MGRKPEIGEIPLLFSSVAFFFIIIIFLFFILFIYLFIYLFFVRVGQYILFLSEDTGFLV